MPKINHKINKNALLLDKGFTLVELLIVIALISVLATATFSVINYTKHKKNAQDAIRRTNMLKLTTAVETFFNAEGKYPTSASDPVLTGYINNGWIVDEPVPGDLYSYWTNGPTYTQMAIMTTLSTGRKLKYHTSWSKIQECASTAIVGNANCP